MPSQFKQDNPGCDCCGATCDDVEDCECVQDGVVTNFPAFQIRLRDWRHVNDVFTPTSCTDICNDTGYNGTWVQYDPCVDGVSADQPEASVLTGNWYMGFSNSVATDPCGGLAWSFKIFLRAYRFSTTEWRVEVCVEDNNSTLSWFVMRVVFTVVECACPDNTDPDFVIMSQVASGGPILTCGRGGEVDFQWL